MSAGPTIGDATVSARTGKTWAQWFRLLDRAGAKTRDHRNIVAVVSSRWPEIGGWWAQMVTVTYEQARGKRAKHEKPEGFEVGASKTVGVPLGMLYRAWTDEKTRRRWLSGARFTVRKASRDKSLRISWDGGSRVSVYFLEKGKGRSQVAVQHGKLGSAAAEEKMKKFWKEKLAKLAKLLEEK